MVIRIYTKMMNGKQQQQSDDQNNDMFMMLLRVEAGGNFLFICQIRMLNEAFVSLPNLECMAFIVDFKEKNINTLISHSVVTYEVRPNHVAA